MGEGSLNKRPEKEKKIANLKELHVKNGYVQYKIFMNFKPFGQIKGGWDKVRLHDSL